MNNADYDRNWWRSAIVDACAAGDFWMADKFTRKLDEHKRRHPNFNAERVARMFIDASPRVRAAYCYQPMPAFTKSIHRLAAWKSQAANET
jgi:hypothetical protein